MKNQVLVVSILLSALFSAHIQAAIKGSFTAVSNEPHFTFPSIDTDNLIQGFARFDDGFSLENSVTTCTFNGYFLVSGDVALNGGTLILEQDLIFRNIASIESMGDIYGDGHVVDLCQTITFLSNGSHVLDNVHIRLSADVVLSGTLVIQGVCSIFGDDHTLTLDGTGAFVINPGAQLNIKNIVLQGITEGKIQCADDTASLVLNNVVWMQDTDVTFSTGSITFLEHVDFVGSATFFYESIQSSTILSDSEWTLRDGMKLSIGRSTLEGVEPLIFVDSTSQAIFENASLLVTSSGIGLTKGTIKIKGDFNLDIVSTQSTFGLILGDGTTTAHDFTVLLDVGASFNFNSGAITYNNITPHGFVSASKESRVTRYPQSQLYVAQNWIVPAFTLQIVGLVPDNVLAPGVTFDYNDTHILFSTVELQASARQLDGPIYSLYGNKYIDFTKGTFPIPVLIAGSGNAMSGNGSLSNVVAFTDSNAALTLGLLGDISENINLNGGTLTLDRNLVLTNDAVINGSGTINLGFHNMSFSAQESVWTSSLTWSGQDATLILNGTLDLSGTWTVSGSFILQGQGNTLDFTQGGKIVVDSNSRLIVRNVRFAGINGNVLDGADNTAEIVLDNVDWVQSGTAIFSKGSLLFKDEVRMIGPNGVFVYQSNQTSTLDSLTTLYLDHEFTFSYDPQNTTERELIYMTDRTSRLLFAGGRLHVAPIGMQLKRGELRVVSDSTIVVDKPVRDDMGNIIVEEGFTLGDSTVETNDVLFNVDSNAVLHIHGSNFAWRNILASSLRMPGNSLYIENNSALFIYNTFQEPRGIVSFFDNTVLGEDYDTGAFLQTSVFVFGFIDFVNI
jgi:hypothetical protein